MVLGAPDSAEFGINADHRNMTKFPNLDDEDFKKLSRTLEFMLQKSGPKVEANWASEAHMKQGNRLRYSGAGFALNSSNMYCKAHFLVSDTKWSSCT